MQFCFCRSNRRKRTENAIKKLKFTIYRCEHKTEKAESKNVV